MRRGDSDRALRLAQGAMRRNPSCPDVYLYTLSEIYFDLAQYQEAIGTLHKMRDQAQGHGLLAASYALIGQIDRARRHAERARAMHPGLSIEQWPSLPPGSSHEPRERLIEGLRIAGLR